MNGKPKSFREQRICTEVSVNGVRYPSLHAAVVQLNVNKNTLRRRCLSTSAMFTEWKILRKSPERHSGVPRPVRIGGIEYASIVEAVRQTGIARTVVSYRCKHQMTVDGVTYELVTQGE